MKTEGGDEALRKFRVSLPHADYFLTFNLAERLPLLTKLSVATAIRDEIRAIESDRHWRTLAAVIMPDHVHFLIHLHDTLPLSRAVARFKSRTKNALAEAGARWQGNYYEHRLRRPEDIGSVLHYIYLNPYRANLVPASGKYPWFWLGTAEMEWFEPSLHDGKPFAEWLR